LKIAAKYDSQQDSTVEIDEVVEDEEEEQEVEGDDDEEQEEEGDDEEEQEEEGDDDDEQEEEEVFPFELGTDDLTPEEENYHRQQCDAAKAAKEVARQKLIQQLQVSKTI
jgi:TATA-binding protein-associated factor Taf7